MKTVWKKRVLDYGGVVLAAAVGVLMLTAPAAQEGEAAAAAALHTAAPGAQHIILDAGHGGFDGGAVGISGTAEAPLNLAVAKSTAKALREAGYRVTMTREDDEALGKDKRSDMQARREALNQEDAAAVVSIHMNKFGDPAVSGPMVYFMEGSAEGERLATSVVMALCSAIGHRERPANPGDYFVIRESKAPAVIVECGFLSNAAEEQKLCDPAYQAQLAKGIAAGVAAYFSLPA